ncbi:hypothetical protein [Butyrivibrio sp. YAB3001]|uniref:hypothetical protein n=1 Tax=Butyrivibrio sp. YAB3001 TaxID=1520812 RepID=UPI0008F645A6|nr:hypothetical protein [Butyrivibrio sp. YAB3001]SFC18040.1 hypothetical protein SAMN02910398_01663 [Butyrivibrio sp. YAB3001]
MTSLLELKQYLKQFYFKYETYISYVWKFVLALISIVMINNKLGYMQPINNIAIVLMASLLCSILPPNFIVLMSAVFLMGHLYSLAVESALIAGVILLLMFLLYFRFSPRDTLAVLLTPLFFFMHIPYVMPLAMGLLGLPTSIVSVSFGIVLAYMINYFSSGATVAKIGTDVEETSNQFQQVIAGILGDKVMLVTIVAFSITIVLVYIIRRASVNYSWRIAIATGSVSLIVCTLIGDLVCETHISFLGVIVGTIVAAALMLVVEFFAFNVDYSRTEKVQFEDDDYYYYVKAVPKVILSAPDRKVKRINRANERQRR